MKRTNKFHLTIVFVSICLVFSFTVTYLVNMFVGKDIWLSAQGYDGNVLEQNGLIDICTHNFMQNKNTLNYIRQYEYKLFGIVDSDNIIAGENDFLFQINDPVYNYNYLKDFIGKHTYSPTEKALFLAELNRRTEYFAALGSDYLLVVLPNTSTIYSEYMPSYMGKISENTRLADLTSYIKRNNGAAHFLNTTEYLLAHKDDVSPLCNNTENTLTTLGLYYAYLAVCDYISLNGFEEEDIISREQLTFRTYLSQGKSIAKQAGLENTVQNRSVSLADNALRYYTTSYAMGYFSKFERTDLPNQGAKTSSVLLQFSKLSDLLQSEPFYACTFDILTMQPNHYQNPKMFDIAAPKMVIQFIYENELAAFVNTNNLN